MISAIILAGGKGKRMGADISKQFIKLKDKPILYYTIKRFSECKDINRIILVLPKDEIDYCKKEVIDKRLEDTVKRYLLDKEAYIRYSLQD